MTSIEIAEVTGKQHKNVMQAIRNMESAWEKVCQGKFSLTSRTVAQPNGGEREVPCYSLTKTECLYVIAANYFLSLFTQLLHTYHGLPMKSAKIIRVNPCHPWSSKKICEICVFNIIATSVMV